MTRAEREAKIAAVVEGQASAPSIREMAKLLGVGIRTVARDYARMGIHSGLRGGRKPADRSTLTEFRLPPAAYDKYCRIAKLRGISVAAAVRAGALGFLTLQGHTKAS